MIMDTRFFIVVSLVPINFVVSLDEWAINFVNVSMNWTAAVDHCLFINKRLANMEDMIQSRHFKDDDIWSGNYLKYSPWLIIKDCVRLRDSSFGLVGAGRKNLQKCTSQCLQKGQSQAGYKFAQSVDHICICGLSDDMYQHVDYLHCTNRMDSTNDPALWLYIVSNKTFLNRKCHFNVPDTPLRSKSLLDIKYWKKDHPFCKNNMITLLQSEEELSAVRIPAIELSVRHGSDLPDRDGLDENACFTIACSFNSCSKKEHSCKDDTVPGFYCIKDNSTVTSTKGYVTTDGMQTTDMTSDSSTWITSSGSESTSKEIHISESNKSTQNDSSTTISESRETTYTELEHSSIGESTISYQSTNLGSTAGSTVEIKTTIPIHSTTNTAITEEFESTHKLQPTSSNVQHHTSTEIQSSIIVTSSTTMVKKTIANETKMLIGVGSGIVGFLIIIMTALSVYKTRVKSKTHRKNQKSDFHDFPDDPYKTTGVLPQTKNTAIGVSSNHNTNTGILKNSDENRPYVKYVDEGHKKDKNDVVQHQSGVGAKAQEILVSNNISDDVIKATGTKSDSELNNHINENLPYISKNSTTSKPSFSSRSDDQTYNKTVDRSSYSDNVESTSL